MTQIVYQDHSGGVVLTSTGVHSKIKELSLDCVFEYYFTIEISDFLEGP